MTSKIVYGWKDTAKHKVSAQIIGEQLESIEQEFGQVTPRVVVDRARPADSVLHQFFEWNDATAAEAHRREQARSLVQAVVVVAYQGEETRAPTRAFVSVIGDGERSYVNIATAMSDHDMREQLLERARQEVEEWRNRYRVLSEFSKVFAAIDKLPPGAVAKRGRRQLDTHVAA